MRKTLRKSEIKELNRKLKRYNYQFSKKDKVEQQDNIILLDNLPIFFIKDSQFIPTLQLLLKQKLLPTVTVDMPAVPFMIKGADIMRPGIKELETFNKGDFITIIDENNKKPLAIGKTLYSSEEIKKLNKGKVIENIHHIGDSIWTFDN